VLLIFWFVLFSTVNGTFMKNFGADSLYLAPEYLGQVNALSAAFVGVSIGIFIMSWNITTFILFSRHFRFLATTSNPFLKYCINNAIVPLLFLGFYFGKAVRFAGAKELMSTGEIALLVAGFLGGLILIIAISLFYFFGADKTIIRRLTPVISNPQLFKAQFKRKEERITQSRLVKVEWYFNSLFTLKKVRDVSHYSREFVETIFNRHHFAAVLSIFIAFIFLVVMGFWLDNPLFQLPAASGITLFFAILIAVSGAFTYFMQSWSIPALVLVFFVLNILYQHNIIDPSNKAYGLNYGNKPDRPAYTREHIFELSAPGKITADKQNMIQILERWKQRQDSKKPVMYIINTSGGGNRSATFTMNTLQYLDSLSNGQLMRKTALIAGASGGMLGAAYFRELSRAKDAGKNIRLQDDQYVDDISGDLLNALFTSFVARDLASPAQKFKVNGYEYIKDRGYAFEQKLNENTHGVLDIQLKHLYEDEKNARTPLMVFSSVITQDSRKMLISTQPVSFLMKPVYDTSKLVGIEPDAVDYQSMFAAQDPMNLRLLTALRMNATFPYVLPNVWLPTNPVIDVMDAGLRDNYGLETTIRFLQVFQDWIRENTNGVVLIQICDRKIASWEPYKPGNVTEIATKPMLLLQYNWYKMQEYSQNDLLCLAQEIMGQRFYKLTFQYLPKKEDAKAALNFHLTRSEKLDINGAMFSDNNQQSFDYFKALLKPKSVPAVP
jgi:hypothetical protein